MNKLTLGLALLSSLVASNAEPVYFPTTDSWYEVVTNRIDWTSARAAAAAASYLGRPGRLATIPSQAENDFVFTNVLGTAASLYTTYWLGAYQPNGPSVAPAEGWEWISGEPWAYTNWRSGGDAVEPNDANGGEHYLEILGSYYGQYGGTWNDFHEYNSPILAGYVIEYAPVFQGEVSIEVSQVRLCWLAPSNHTFQLQYRSELTTNTWINVGEPVSGFGTNVCVTDEVTTPEKFYRVITLP
jgi:hypothetical protein